MNPSFIQFLNQFLSQRQGRQSLGGLAGLLGAQGVGSGLGGVGSSLGAINTLPAIFPNRFGGLVGQMNGNQTLNNAALGAVGGTTLGGLGYNPAQGYAPAQPMVNPTGRAGRKQPQQDMNNPYGGSAAGLLGASPGLLF